MTVHNNRSRLSSRLRSRRGLASALIIMLLVLLVFFGVLSLVTSAADYRLAQKRAAWNKDFYQADSEAVRIMAALDDYCGALDSDSLQPEKLKESLDGWLSGQAGLLSSQTVLTEDGSYLLLDALVGQRADSGQGIAMRLRVATGTLPAGSGRISVEGWSQWQPEFDYSGSEGGIWKG